MTARELLLELKSIMEEERELLLSFPIRDVERFGEIQEKKREILLMLSRLNVEDLEGEKELLLELRQLNVSISGLILNGLSFFEELERELFGQTLTYEEKKRRNLFSKKA